MQSYFKTKAIKVDDFDLTVQELSVKDHLDYASLPPSEKAATICSRCVKEWQGESVDTINSNVPARVLGEVIRVILDLSGLLEAKNSEATPDAGSSTA